MAARFPLVAGCPLMLRISRLTPEAAIVGKSSKTPTPARRMRDRLARGRADSQPRRGRRYAAGPCDRLGPVPGHVWPHVAIAGRCVARSSRQVQEWDPLAVSG